MMMADQDKTVRLLFFNLAIEVDDYLKKRVSTQNVDICISMNPIVFSYLKQKGVPCENTLSYFTTHSHESALKRSKILVELLREQIDFFDMGLGIQQAYKVISLFYLRVAIHYHLWVIEIVLNAIEQHHPKILCVWHYGNNEKSSSLYIEPRDGCLSSIVKKIANVKNIYFEEKVLKTSGSFLKGHWSEAILCTKFILRCFHIKIKTTFFKIKKLFISARKVVFFTTKFYRLDKIITQLEGQYPKYQYKLLKWPVILTNNMPNFLIKLFWWNSFSLIKLQKKKTKALIYTIEKNKDQFLYRNVLFSDLLVKKTEKNIIHHIIGLSMWTVDIFRLLDVVQPKTLLSVGNRSDDVILAELCQVKDIACVLMSHGSHVPPKNESEEIEWGEHGVSFLRAPFSHLALQTPLAEDYLQMFPSQGKIFKTGPLIWGNPIQFEKREGLRKKYCGAAYLKRNTRIIVHAGTYKYSNSLRFYVYETADEYVKSICDLAHVVEQLKDTVLIIKFRPGYELTTEALQQLVPFSKKVILNVDDSFLDVLSAADLLVSFSSTCIEEALQNRIPVLLYGGSGRYQHISATQIKPSENVKASAIYVIQEVSCLDFGIRKIFELRSENTQLFDPYIYPVHMRKSVFESLFSVM